MKSHKDHEQSLYPMLPKENIPSSEMVALLDDRLKRMTNKMATIANELETRKLETQQIQLSGNFNCIKFK